jgi:hypothetical protein
VDRAILIDEPKKFFKSSKRTKHRRCGRGWQVLQCELHVFDKKMMRQSTNHDSKATGRLERPGNRTTKEENSMNCATSLVRTLVASGVDTCFANPGTSEMHFVAALGSSK